MLKSTIRFSRGGLVASGLFLLLAGAVFAWVFLIAFKNPPDSGESGLLLLPFAMPWIMYVPHFMGGPLMALGSILFSAVILYLVFGGLRITLKHQ